MLKEKEDRQIKHLQLNDKIDSLFYLKEHINRLISRIKNEELLTEIESSQIESSYKNEKRKEPLPSLYQILTEGPDRIYKNIQECHDLLEKLEDILF